VEVSRAATLEAALGAAEAFFARNPEPLAHPTVAGL